MAEFVGSLSEFNKYYGPHCKNLVNRFAKSFRQQGEIHNCEHCNNKGVLEAAHRDGKERPLIIRNILQNNFLVHDDMYHVDLDKFELLFRDCHFPIREHFWFLCKDCHRKYDNKTITNEDIFNNLLIKEHGFTSEMIKLNDKKLNEQKEINYTKTSLAIIDNYQDFECWLKKRYKENTSKTYIYWINKVMERESLSWNEIKNNIGKFVTNYEFGGKDWEYGQQGHRSVICALKSLQFFIRSL